MLLPVAEAGLAVGWATVAGAACGCVAGAAGTVVAGVAAAGVVLAAEGCAARGCCVVRGAVWRARGCGVVAAAGGVLPARLSSASELVTIWAWAVPAPSIPAAQSRERRPERENFFVITVQTSPEGGKDKTEYSGKTWQKDTPSCGELFFGNTFGESLPRIKQQGYGQVAVLADLNGDDIAHLNRIGHGGHGPFFGFHNRKANMGG